VKHTPENKILPLGREGQHVFESRLNKRILSCGVNILRATPSTKTYEPFYVLTQKLMTHHKDRAKQMTNK
jgi:hypothetical protein